ncbi:tetratricopeptide repeat protein [Halopseudomonas litoralis]|nr:tetratricopeptide repeat protein [Halopseudomonas litoralis]
MTARFHHSLLAMTISLLVTGCAINAPEPAPAPPVSVAAAPNDETMVDEPKVYGQFQTDTLYALLTAEIAGQRNRFDIALRNYLEQAVRTRDAGIIERAMEISEFLGAHQHAMDMALLWTEVQPDNPEALRAAALQLARAGQHDDAMHMMEQVLLLQDDTHFDLLALTALQADSTTRTSMLENLQSLLQRYPGNAQLSFAAALLLQEEQRSEEAIALLDEHTRDNGTAASIMLQSRLHAELGAPDKAIEVLQTGVRKFPNDSRMRLLLARMLVNSGDHQAAITHFRELARQNPDDDEVRLALALVELEDGDTEAAIGELQGLLETDPTHGAAAYHLGAAHEQAGQWDAAISTWQSIGAGEEYLPSRLRIIRLLVERQRMAELTNMMHSERARHPQLAPELFLLEIEALINVDPQLAMQRANQALEQLQYDSRLLYTRAMLADRLGNPAGLETDLRLIIQREPENAMALNALGYTLADRNEQLDEALQLVEKAHDLMPEDPAIMDSLGWVHYRLGNLERAEQLLREAFAAFPDAEVGAHLGEVLWQRGKHREARAIWDQAADQAEDTSMIDATRKRLEAD